MSVNTKWDVNYYKTDYESEEHWNLRKKFMEVHKDKFPEDELVCLAQVFTNVEFMGCKYPDETMMLVAHLSQEVAEEFRQKRAQRLQRTFVKASDAAEARYKGSAPKTITTPISSYTPENNPTRPDSPSSILLKPLTPKQDSPSSILLKSLTPKPDSQPKPPSTKRKIAPIALNIPGSPMQQFTPAGTDTSCTKESSISMAPILMQNFFAAREPNSLENTSMTAFSMSSIILPSAEPTQTVRDDDDSFFKDSKNFNVSSYLNKKKENIDLFKNLTFGKFVLYIYGNRSSIFVSGQKAGVKVEEKESILKNGLKKVDILLDGKTAGSGVAASIKEAKATAFKNAMEKLKDQCYSIKPNRDPDRININKTDKIVVCSVKKSTQEPKLDSSNIGYKMMQKLGWSGGGLGPKRKGIENPVDYLVKNNRLGLGSKNDTINSGYFRKLLDNYIKSEDIRDLYFESGFTKEERATLHQIAAQKNLKSSSHGKDPNRHLIISKKNIPARKIITEILINENQMYIDKYEVTVPKRMGEFIPDDNTADACESLISTNTEESPNSISFSLPPQYKHPRPRKRKLESSSDQDALTQKDSLSLSNHFKRPAYEDDRFDIFGKNVATKLRDLGKQQRLLAEKIINDTLFEAEMGNLTMSNRFNGPQQHISPNSPELHVNMPEESAASSSFNIDEM